MAGYSEVGGAQPAGYECKQHQGLTIASKAIQRVFAALTMTCSIALLD
jgi:hypothetical protein